MCLLGTQSKGDNAVVYWHGEENPRRSTSSAIHGRDRPRLQRMIVLAGHKHVPVSLCTFANVSGTGVLLFFGT